MIEEVKELLHLIEKLPHMAMYVLGGFALYKLLMYASTTSAIVFLLRLAITKAFDAYALQRKPKTVEMEFILNGVKMFDSSRRKIELLLRHLHDARNSGKSYKSEYLDDGDVDYLARAFADKINAEQAAKEKK